MLNNAQGNLLAYWPNHIAEIMNSEYIIISGKEQQ